MQTSHAHVLHVLIRQRMCTFTRSVVVDIIHCMDYLHGLHTRQHGSLKHSDPPPDQPAPPPSLSTPHAPPTLNLCFSIMQDCSPCQQRLYSTDHHLTVELDDLLDSTACIIILLRGNCTPGSRCNPNCAVVAKSKDKICINLNPQRYPVLW